jgi:hypothetical protein
LWSLKAVEEPPKPVADISGPMTAFGQGKEAKKYAKRCRRVCVVQTRERGTKLIS